MWTEFPRSTKPHPLTPYPQPASMAGPDSLTSQNRELKDTRMIGPVLPTHKKKSMANQKKKAGDRDEKTPER